jgi:hypothetical protein
VACILAIALATSGIAQSGAPDPQTLALARKIEALEQALAEVKAELPSLPGEWL